MWQKEIVLFLHCTQKYKQVNVVGVLQIMQIPATVSRPGHNKFNKVKHKYKWLYAGMQSSRKISFLVKI